jgi:hypothetical protein
MLRFKIIPNLWSVLGWPYAQEMRTQKVKEGWLVSWMELTVDGWYIQMANSGDGKGIFFSHSTVLMSKLKISGSLLGTGLQREFLGQGHTFCWTLADMITGDPRFSDSPKQRVLLYMSLYNMLCVPGEAEVWRSQISVSCVLTSLTQLYEFSFLSLKKIKTQ